MDWANETWVKLYVRNTVDDALLSWEARALWAEIFRRLDRSGVLQVGKHGWRGVAVIVGMPVDVVERVAPDLVADGRIVEREECLVAPNYVEAQAVRSSDAQRQRDSRERRRAEAMLSQSVTPRHQLPASVTDCDTESQSVTECHQVSPGVTGGHDKSREEKNRGDKSSSLVHPPAARSEVTAAELLAGYELYPLKKGKKSGLAKAAKVIKTREQLERYRACIEHMAEAFSSSTDYCVHFSTFVNQELWDDDEWPSPRVSKPQQQDSSVGGYKHTGDETYGDGVIDL